MTAAERADDRLHNGIQLARLEMGATGMVGEPR
jgi:hypothetical protein